MRVQLVAVGVTSVMGWLWDVWICWDQVLDLFSLGNGVWRSKLPHGWFCWVRLFEWVGWRRLMFLRRDYCTLSCRKGSCTCWKILRQRKHSQHHKCLLLLLLWIYDPLWNNKLLNRHWLFAVKSNSKWASSHSLQPTGSQAKWQLWREGTSQTAPSTDNDM